MKKIDKILLIINSILIAILVAVLLWIQSSIYCGVCYGI